MKGFLVLLCCIAIAQARSTALQSSSRFLAVNGENPWFVHLRMAVETSGFLNTGAGTLINSGWVLTADEILEGVRFVWVRYGVVTVWNPTLVTEVSNSATAINIFRKPGSVGLIRLNRVVVTDGSLIRPIALLTGDLPDWRPEIGRQCGFGALEDGKAGEQLTCHEVILVKEESVIATDGTATKFDLGAPLVVEGESDTYLAGVLVSAEQEDGSSKYEFVATEEFSDWVQETAF